VHDSHHFMHGGRADEWDELHVHGCCDECVGYRFCVGCFVCSDAVDGSWCTDWCDCDQWREFSVGCVLDCSGF